MNKIIDGRTDLVIDYINNGNSPNSTDDNGTPLICWCAYYGDVSAVKFLLLQGEKLQSLGDNFDLSGCCFHGHWQLCQFLIEQGANVNFQHSVSAESPLHAALCKANRLVYEHIVTLLLSAGADPNIKTNPSVDTQCFMRACKTKGETPLHRAAAFGSEQIIQRLLDAGADIKAEDQNGDTPLAWASWHLRPAKILKMLCYDNFSLHPQFQSSYDHGAGWGQLDLSMLGKPHI